MTNRQFISYCFNGDIEGVKKGLKDPDVDPGYRNNHSLAWAINKNHPDIVKLLLNDSRVNPSYSYNNSIYIATSHSFYSIIELLVADPRVDPTMATRHRSSAFTTAILSGDLNAIKLLCKTHKSLTYQDNFLIKAAIQWSTNDVIKYLITREEIFKTIFNLHYVYFNILKEHIINELNITQKELTLLYNII